MPSGNPPSSFEGQAELDQGQVAAQPGFVSLLECSSTLINSRDGTLHLAKAMLPIELQIVTGDPGHFIWRNGRARPAAVRHHSCRSRQHGFQTLTLETMNQSGIRFGIHERDFHLFHPDRCALAVVQYHVQQNSLNAYVVPPYAFNIKGTGKWGGARGRNITAPKPPPATVHCRKMRVRSRYSRSASRY